MLKLQKVIQSFKTYLFHQDGVVDVVASGEKYIGPYYKMIFYYSS